jgi:hypothetical protein
MLEVHGRGTAEVLAFGIHYAGAGDGEDGYAAAVGSLYLDGDELAAAREAEASQEEIVRADGIRHDLTSSPVERLHRTSSGSRLVEERSAG